MNPEQSTEFSYMTPLEMFHYVSNQRNKAIEVGHQLGSLLETSVRENLRLKKELESLRGELTESNSKRLGTFNPQDPNKVFVPLPQKPKDRQLTNTHITRPQNPVK